MSFERWLLVGLSAVCLSACMDGASLPVSSGMGRDPVLPAPRHHLIPTVKVARAVGWPPGITPSPAYGMAVAVLADHLDHPRWLYVLPNGDVLVAETNAPSKPKGEGGIKGWIKKQVMKEAGAGGASANRITLLRDADADGEPEGRYSFLEGLHSPFGMALIGKNFYVANTDAVVRYPYQEGQTRITAPGTRILELPAGPINQHWTRNLIASQDGRRLYVTVGSNSNVGENGLENEEGRAAIWELDPKTGAHRIFASGLRNPNGLAWEPETGALWTAVNERDELGGDLVPDYLTAVKEGGFYGWPYSYFGQNIDKRVKPTNSALVRRAIEPDYALGAHTASLGLASSKGANLPARFANGMFVGQHGSWNRDPFSGYQVVFVPFREGRPIGKPLVVLTDFLSGEGEAYGRPVGVALDQQGALLVADDVGNVVWRVTGTGG